MLLPGFTVGKNATNLKEFFVDINSTGKFRIHFVPSVAVSAAFGFVNAIELFSTGLNFSKVQMKSNVLEKIYRINVGGMEVNSSDDPLWRTWVEDDQYLVSKSDTINAKFYSEEIKYYPQLGAAKPDDAPDFVYRTAKTLKNNGKYNLTWEFNATKVGVHLVRLHFCDIIGVNGPYLINVYINGKLMEGNLNPYTITYMNEPAVPFYRDYPHVEVGNVEMIKVSLEPVNSTGIFLNGLEIMLLKNGTALDPLDGDGSHLKVIVPVVIAAIALIVALIAVVLFNLRRRKSKSVEESEWGVISMYGVSSNHKSSKTSSSHASNLQNLHLGLKIPFDYIQKATNNFDASLIIGEGGFGKVYKALFKNGVKVAVKRSSPDHGQGLAEFQTEIMVLSQIRHRHLVSLIGYCYEDDEMILVYEFMEKGTLREHLYDDSKGIAISSNCLGLNWIQRLEICIGAAKGLHYLHTGSDRGIIHRDVKSTNILLDDHYVAKVADFGLSRLGHLEQAYVSTDVKGTLGYLDPEYYGCMQLTEKSDVYSFGVVLLEVLCARPVINRALPSEQVNLAHWGMICIEQGKVEHIIDPSIAGEVTETALTKFTEAAAKCLTEGSAERPPMSDVIWDLEYALLLQRAATEGEVPGDTMTDASLNMPMPGDSQLFSSLSFSDVNNDVTITSTREVSSQLKVEI
ncbi:putative receptor-like protein kinase At2g23200 isoform X2 [Silene latifolia]